MGEFSGKEHWQNCYGTVEDDFLEIIDAINGDIIFFMSLLLLITFHLQ
jgi:hypothetical protein